MYVLYNTTTPRHKEQAIWYGFVSVSKSPASLLESFQGADVIPGTLEKLTRNEMMFHRMAQKRHD